MPMKEAILGADDLSYDEVRVPEWNQTVRVRTMTGAERDQYEANINNNRGADGKLDTRTLRATLVVLTVVDEHGDRVFELADVPALQLKNANALEAVFDVARKLNGLGDEALEEAEGNSNGTPTE